MTPRAQEVIVNGVAHTVTAASDELLLGWLRGQLGLTGTKFGCGEEACGACSVLVDGALARSCVVTMSEVAGGSVTTVEGLADDGRPHRVQRAFLEEGAMQCGFCTPGMVVAAVALLDAHPHPDDEEILRWMSPNVCRCCTYPRIVAAIRRASASGKRDDTPVPTTEPDVVLRGRPRIPWDLCPAEERDYFALLGDGMVVVAPQPESAPGIPTLTGGAWLHVAPSGAVTAFTGKVDVGQGTRRALRGVIADELDVELGDVTLVMGDTDVCPFDIGTFGSLAMPTAMPDLRRAAATARAARQRSGPLRSGERRLEIADPETRSTSQPRRRALDDARSVVNPAMVTGAARYVSDATAPGMLHGAVLRPPCWGARLRSIDVSKAAALEDVTVTVDGEFVGACAPTLASARRALAAIAPEWELPAPVREADLEQHLRAHAASVEGWDVGGWGGVHTEETGDVDAALAAASVQLRATYTTAYLAHVPLETRVALAEWDAGGLTVRVGTQRPFGARRVLAEALAVREADVRVIVPATGTGFGGKHDPDVALAAARLARAAGAPVRVQWSREEEFAWAYFRPAAVIDVQAGAAVGGAVTAWDFLDLNAGAAALGMPYEVANCRLRFEPSDSPLRQGSYRALAATANNFARESCVDELAHQLGLDPVELRLRNLGDARLAAVLTAAARRFGWADRPRGDGFGTGVALGFEKGGRVATCVLVRIEEDVLNIVRVVTAFECGAVVDPDNLRKQIEGATIMGLGGALFEAAHFANGCITNGAMSRYRLPRFPDVPPIEIEILDRPDLPSAGGGETPIITIAPALASAIFDATGRRIRSLPLLEHGYPVPATSGHPI